MRIRSTKTAESAQHKQHARQSASTAAASFAQMLKEANATSNPPAVAEGDIVPIGVISNTQPTVSDLLINNRQFHDDTWKIIHSKSNAQKNYARMQPGTTVSIDRQTFELVWEERPNGATSVTAQNDAQSAPRQGGDSTNIPSGTMVDAAATPSSDGEETGNGNKVLVGRLDGKHSSVAQLLLQNSQFRGAAWQIIQAGINRHKAFTGIRSGAEVFIDPRTLELSWQRQNDSLPQADAARAAKAATEPAEEAPADSLSSHLVRAVRSYLGRSYREINCYGLVVRGLQRLGIKYAGHGGLQNQLIQMAKSKGLAENAYMTGEGLIQASGEKVFTTTLENVKNIEQDAGAIYHQMKPYLQKGYILSFSTPTRGHTGVISQHDQTWTFINSGYLDNQIAKSKHSKGVGEEVLAREIRNWCKVASKKRESLVITLGRLEEEKLRTVRVENPQASAKV